MHVEHLYERFGQVLEQVKAIGDLGRLGRPLPGTVGIGFGPVARDHLHTRVGLEPLREGVGIAITPERGRLTLL